MYKNKSMSWYFFSFDTKRTSSNKNTIKNEGVSKHRPEMATTTSDHDRRPDKFGLSSLFALSAVENV